MGTTNSADRPIDWSKPALLRGAVVGLVVALSFALIISVLPEELFELQSWWIALTFLVVIVAGPPSVWLVKAVTRPPAGRLYDANVGAMLGAMAFDGLAIGFIPGLYGQDAMDGVGAVLLVAFCALGVSGVLMSSPRRT